MNGKDPPALPIQKMLKWKNKPSTAEKIRRHDAAVKHKKKNTKNPEIKTIKSRGKTKQVRKYHNNEYREGE